LLGIAVHHRADLLHQFCPALGDDLRRCRAAQHVAQHPGQLGIEAIGGVYLAAHALVKPQRINDPPPNKSVHQQTLLVRGQNFGLRRKIFEISAIELHNGLPGQFEFQPGLIILPILVRFPTLTMPEFSGRPNSSTKAWRV
jgi:hypothetical protein